MKNTRIYSEIKSTGKYIPLQLVKNEDLVQFPPATHKIIEQKTGVKSRYYAKRDEFVSDLGFEAAKSCLAKAGIPANAVEAVILATSSPDRVQPATATRILDKLGAKGAYGFDVNSVCSGAIVALNIADSLIRSGLHKNILVIASEIYSRILNHKDFATCPYFGDGAGALLLTASTEEKGVVKTIIESDGAGHNLIQVHGGGTMLPYDRVTNPRDLYFTMEGRAVFNFAVEKGSKIILKLIKELQLSTEEIDFVVAHQANLKILEEISQRVGIGYDRFFVNLHKYGNTAGASVLIGLDELLEERSSIKNIILVSFGGGLTWGASLIRM